MGLGAVVIGIIVLVVIVGFIGVGIYNKLVTSKEVVDSSLSNIDSIWSTHPNTYNRIERLEEML